MCFTKTEGAGTSRDTFQRGGWSGRFCNLGKCESPVFEFDLGSDGSCAAPGVVWMDETCHSKVFGKKGQKLEDVYPIKRYPLI